MTAFRFSKVLVHPHRIFNSQPIFGINDAPLNYTQTFLRLPNFLSSQNLKVPGSLPSVPGLIFSSLCSSVLGLSSLSPRPIVPEFQAILPQSQAYLLAVSGLSSRFIFPQYQLIFPQFQPILPQLQPIFPQSQSYPPHSSKPTFPQFQAYRLSVPAYLLSVPAYLPPFPSLLSLNPRPILLRPGLRPIFPQFQAYHSSTLGLLPHSPIPL